jgi:hypothetical protein
MTSDTQPVEARGRATTAQGPRATAGSTSATAPQPQGNPVPPRASPAALITGCSSESGTPRRCACTRPDSRYMRRHGGPSR